MVIRQQLYELVKASFQLMMSATSILNVTNVKHMLSKMAQMYEFNLVSILSFAND